MTDLVYENILFRRIFTMASLFCNYLYTACPSGTHFFNTTLPILFLEFNQSKTTAVDSNDCLWEPKKMPRGSMGSLLGHQFVASLRKNLYIFVYNINNRKMMISSCLQHKIVRYAATVLMSNQLLVWTFGGEENYS